MEEVSWGELELAKESPKGISSKGNSLHLKDEDDGEDEGEEEGYDGDGEQVEGGEQQQAPEEAARWEVHYPKDGQLFLVFHSFGHLTFLQLIFFVFLHKSFTHFFLERGKKRMIIGPQLSWQKKTQDKILPCPRSLCSCLQRTS